MSIQTEINRIGNAVANIKSSIASKGVTVPSTAKIDSLSGLIDNIPVNSGPTIRTGTFTATGTSNQRIAHGLGKTPTYWGIRSSSFRTGNYNASITANETYITISRCQSGNVFYWIAVG